MQKQVKEKHPSVNIPMNRYIYSFPNQINEFRFLKLFQNGEGSKRYRFALYKSNKGKIAFAKAWNGIVPNMDYFWLKNEIAVYRLFEKKRKNLQNSLKNLQEIFVPHLYYSQVKLNHLILLIEYMDAKPLTGVSPSNKSQIYAKVLDFIRVINKTFEGDSNGLSRRPAIYWSILFPVITLRAILRYPSHYKLILRSFVFFLMNLRYLIADNDRQFIHRDLSDFNVRISGKKVWLFDFQLSSIMHPIVEEVIVLMKHWGDKKFVDEFSSQNRDINSVIFRIYANIMAIYDLSLNNAQSHKSTLEFLEFNLGLFSLPYCVQAYKDYLFNLFISNETKVIVKPYDKKIEKVANRIIRQLKEVYPELEIEFIGSAALKLPGQNDIDLVAKSSSLNFNKIAPLINSKFGTYVKRRNSFIEWKFDDSGFEVEINLMDPDTVLYNQRVAVFKILKKNKFLYDEYAKLKQDFNGSGQRDYELAKSKFLNRVRGVI
jgi:GrpB-like predicted nucleotidyltransferase (UPF0157 family)